MCIRDRDKDSINSLQEDEMVEQSLSGKIVGAGFLARHDPDEFERLASLGDYACLLYTSRCV